MRQRRGQTEGCRAGRETLPAAFGLSLAVLGALLLPILSARSQTSTGLPEEIRIFYCRNRVFRIPFSDPKLPIKEVRLFVSTNQGRNWEWVATAQPKNGDRSFPFTADHDGCYWFAVQTEDFGKVLVPPVMNSTAPVSEKIYVDTLEPRVYLQSVAAGNGKVGVTWNVQNDNLSNLNNHKQDTLILEYRTAGSNAPWMRLDVEPKPEGQFTWNPQTNASLEVRLRAFDDAGNEGQRSISIDAAMTRSLPPGGSKEVAPSGPPARSTTTPGDRQLVNSKQFNLTYEVHEVGASGLSEIELWCYNGKTWSSHGKKLKPEKPKPDSHFVFPVKVPEEGVYGFTLVARSGVGLGDPPPKAGDLPQIWIEVDCTKPRVVLQTPEVGQGMDEGNLFINYTAEDENLDHEGSITLSYAQETSGPWTKFAQTDNTGHYIWRMPPDVPFQFHIRVEATDRAGNTGKADTRDLVKVDLSRPKTRVLTVVPVSKGESVPEGESGPGKPAPSASPPTPKKIP